MRILNTRKFYYSGASASNTCAWVLSVTVCIAPFDFVY